MTEQLLSRRLTAEGRNGDLTTAKGAALYVGALLGPGLLLLPGLAAAEAGPASIVAWLALLGLSGMFAAVFSALGQRYPQAGGIMGYVAAGLGRRASRIAGWSFLGGVVGGAPIVCLIGASYVAGFTGGGRAIRAAIAALLVLAVLALAATGLRASAKAQVVLVVLLIAVVTVAVGGSGRLAQIGNWRPFAPHGWLSVGHAATTLMLSFVGWEAVAPLTTRFAKPSRQLPRVIAIALAATTALYLGLAIATISVLGRGAATAVPLADLLRVAIGPAGTVAAAAAAVVLTLGAVNAYVNGAATMAWQLIGPARQRAAERQGQRETRPGETRPSGTQPGGTRPGGTRRRGPELLFLAAIAASGLLLITLYGLGIVSTVSLVALPTALFLAVYLASMLAAARVLSGRVRGAAITAVLAVLVMLPYCGWSLTAPAAIAMVLSWPWARIKRPKADQAKRPPSDGRRPEDPSRAGHAAIRDPLVRSARSGYINSPVAACRAESFVS
jgi:amino acid efflux transporter